MNVLRNRLFRASICGHSLHLTLEKIGSDVRKANKLFKPLMTGTGTGTVRYWKLKASFYWKLNVSVSGTASYRKDYITVIQFTSCKKMLILSKSIFLQLSLLSVLSHFKIHVQRFSTDPTYFPRHLKLVLYLTSIHVQNFLAIMFRNFQNQDLFDTRPMHMLFKKCLTEFALSFH